MRTHIQLKWLVLLAVRFHNWPLKTSYSIIFVWKEPTFQKSFLFEKEKGYSHGHATL